MVEVGIGIGDGDGVVVVVVVVVVVAVVPSFLPLPPSALPLTYSLTSLTPIGKPGVDNAEYTRSDGKDGMGGGINPCG